MEGDWGESLALPFPFRAFLHLPLPLSVLRLPRRLLLSILEEVTSHADVLKAPSSGGTSDEVLRTSACEANFYREGTNNLILP